MNLPAAIAKLQAGRDLDAEEMRTVMQQIMTGEATPAQIGAILMGLSMKGETVTEVFAAAETMQNLAIAVSVDIDGVVDIVGTGGDGAHTFNVSTAASFVVAGAGVRVAKHGTRSVSSSSGAADVLEAAGVNLNLEPEQIARCIEIIGIGFMFAPRHHAAMKYAAGPRREMGVRTLFNVLGPITNPAGVRHHLLGVYHRRWLEPLAEVLGRLGSQHALVVHAEDGLDEISIAAPTEVAELRAGQINTYRLTPEDLGLKTAPLDTLRVEDVSQSLALLTGILEGRQGPARDIVLLNAAAALYAADAVGSLAEGVSRAVEAIDSGGAHERLSALASFSQELA